jgi:hypothetical protein
VKGSSDDCAGTMTTDPQSHPHLILQKILNRVTHSSSAIAHPHRCTMGTHGHQPLTRLPVVLLSSMWLNRSALVSSVLHTLSSSFSNTSLYKNSSPCTTDYIHLLPHSSCLGQCGPCNSVRDLQFSGLEKEGASSQCQFRLVVLVPHGIKTTSCYCMI